MEENNVTPKLLLSFVVDNSISMREGKMAELMPAFREFAAMMEACPHVEFELILFDQFAPTVAKEFASAEVQPVTAGKLPLLGRAIDLAADRIEARTAELAAAAVPVFRPWMFILSDGMTFDAMEESTDRLDLAEREGKPLYLPFRLSKEIYSERLQYLDRTKHMVEILSGHIGDFFDFAAKMAQLRGTMPSDATVKFSKSDFEGWAVL